MYIKKNALTNVIWFLFVILTFGMLLITATGITEKLGKNNDVLFIGMSYFVILIGAEIIYAISLLFFKANFKEALIPNDSGKFLEIIYLIFVSVLMFMVRFIYLVNNGDIILGSQEYYLMISNNNISQAQNISPLAYVYTYFIRYCFDSLGVSKSVCMYMQAILHVGIFLSTYFTLKYLINKVAGVFGSLLFAFLVYNITDVSRINPQTFFTLIFSISLLLITYSSYCSNKRQLNRKKLILYFSVSGIFAGFFAYLDYSGILFLIPAILIIFNANKDNPSSNKKYSSIIQSVIFIISAIIGFVASYLVVAIHTKQNVVSLFLNDYSFSNYVFKINLFVTAPAYGTYFSAALIGLSFLWLFRIFAIERDYASSIILFTFMVVALSFFSLERVEYSNIITMLYIYLASIGFASLGSNKIIVEKIEEEKEEDLQTIKEKKQKDKERKEQLKKELKIREKEEKMQKLKNNSGINTTLTSDTKPEEELEFLKNLKPVNKPNNQQASANVNNETKLNNNENNVNNKEIIKTEVKNKEAVNAPINAPVFEGNLKPVMPPQSQNNQQQTQVVTNVPNTPNTPNTPSAQNNPVLGNLNPVKPVVNNNPVINANPVLNANPVIKANPVTNANPVVNNNPVTNANPVINNNPVVNSTPAVNNNSVIAGTVTNADNSEVKVIKSISDPSAKKFARRMDYKTAIVKSSSLPESSKDNSTNVNKQNNIATVNSDSANNSNNQVVNNTNISNVKSEPIKNPLPTPKKHVPREMDFDIIPAENDMHFDIVNLQGKDFFDIN